MSTPEPTSTSTVDSTAPFISYAAKAIAAFVVPWVLLAAAWLAENVGIELSVEAGAVEAAVVSIVSAIAVYIKRNADRTPAG
jgi:hypothetical protein